MAPFKLLRRYGKYRQQQKQAEHPHGKQAG
jgi:rRNA maturation protein Nop10